MPGVSDVSVKVGMDATAFREGSRRVQADVKNIGKAMDPANMSLRQQQSLARRLYQDTRTPLEQYQAQLQRISILHQRGLIDQNLYRRSVDQAAASYRRAAGAASGMNKAAGAGAPLFTKLAGSVSAYLGPIVLAYGAVRNLTGAFKELDDVAKESRAIGMQAQSLAEFQYAAGISGVEAEKFRKSMRDMTRRVGEAGRGRGQAAPALEELGLDPRGLAAAGTEEAFLRIVEAIDNYEGAMGKASLAYDLFGRQGVRLVNMLNLGRGGVEELREEYRRLAGVMSDTSAFEDAQDAALRTKTAWGGLWREMAETSGPGLVRTMDGLSRAFVSFREAIAIPGDLKAGTADWIDIIDRLAAVTEQAVRPLTFANKWIRQMRERLEELRGAGKADMAGATGNKTDSQPVVDAEAEADALEDLDKAREKAANTLADVQKQIDQFDMTDAARSVDDFSRSLAESGMDATEAAQKIEEYRQTIEELESRREREKTRKEREAAAEGAGDTAAEWRDALREAQEAIAAFTEEDARAGKQLDLPQIDAETRQKAMDAIAEKFADDPFGMESALEPLREMDRALAEVEERMKRMNEDATLTKRFEDAGKALQEKWETPLERAERRMRGLAAIIESGALDMGRDQRTIAMEVQAIQADRFAQQGPLLTGAKEAGSREAYSAIAEHEAGGSRQQRMERAIAAALAALQQVARNTDPQGRPRPSQTNVNIPGY